MKHLTSTVVLCAASVLGVSAQTIIITDKDGVAHRFNADYVKEITFEPSQSQDETLNLSFTSVKVNPYNLTNIEVTLECENGDNVDLDLTQPSAMWLTAGKYLVGGAEGFVIDPSWSSVVLGGEKKEIKEGSLEVQLDGDVYTFTVDVVLVNDQVVKGTFTGKLDKFGPVANYDLTGAVYVEVNDPSPNGFYYKFNDEGWKIEMRIDLFSEGNAPKAGTYNFSESTDNGCAGSYVSLYAPYHDTTSFKEGTVTVEEDGENTIINIDGVLENGLHMTASYKGKLPERPVVALEDIQLDFAKISVNPYNLTNIEVTLECENGDNVDLDLTQPSAMWLTAGKYSVGGAEGFVIDPSWSSVVLGGEKKEIKEGSLEVQLDGDVYTFTVDVVLVNDQVVKGTFTGKLDKFGPVANYDLTGAVYVEVNDPSPNGFYYKFNDEGWKIEMRIDLFSEGNAPKAGTYNFSESTDNGCAGSYVSLYAPYHDTTSFKEGTVTVEEDGENTIINIDGVLENGLHMTASYKGKLPERAAE
ncbi:MAG: hypothetical protein K2J46_02965 [Muribaculaceae bacterium]|nr:hypothetical protein [Muribaculaceae bacterium]